MARINVDDDWFIDILGRRAKLTRLVAEGPALPEDVADGMALRAWRLAQRYWKESRSLIPLEVFQQAGLGLLIEADLAVINPEGVYVRGTKNHHEWLHSRKEAAAEGGRASAASRLRKNGSAVPKGASNTPKQNRTKTEAKASKPNPLLYSTLAKTTFSSFDESRSDPKLEAPKAGQVWDAYKGAYFSRYGKDPVRNARSNALCSQLIKRLGGDGAVSVVKFYLTHNKRWYIDKVHDLSACVGDAEGLHTQMLADHRVSSTEAMQADKGQSQAQVFAAVTEKLKRELEANGGKF